MESSCNNEVSSKNKDIDQGVRLVCDLENAIEKEKQPLDFQTGFLLKPKEYQNSESDSRDWLCKPLLGGGFLLKCKLKDSIRPYFTVCPDQGKLIISVQLYLIIL